MDELVEKKSRAELRAMRRRLLVLKKLDEFWMREYIPPTIRELSKMTGVNSTSQIRSILEKLAESGQLVVVEKEGYVSGKYQKHYYPHWVKDAIDAGKPSFQ